MSACVGNNLGGDSNILFCQGDYPFITTSEGNYYLTFQNITVDSIFVHCSKSVEGLAKSEPILIWAPEKGKMSNIYSPELHKVNGKWYVYFEADNGINTDTHQLYVIENSFSDPLKGTWSLHGPIVTDEEWNFGLHPTSFINNGKQYLLWSGWNKRRTETETQCIFIAEMENPWTLKSERVMISSPVYEWERQWINPDGSRTSYPIYVNENPSVMISPDRKTITVAYSASGIWTDYSTLGIIHANAADNLLDSASWTKEPEPFFTADYDSGIFGTSNISAVASLSDDTHILVYGSKHFDHDRIMEKEIRWKKISWSESGLPELGSPL